jgi:hypothetical protein
VLSMHSWLKMTREAVESAAFRDQFVICYSDEGGLAVTQARRIAC